MRRSSRAAGWDVIEPTIIELEKKMRDAENEPHEGYALHSLSFFLASDILPSLATQKAEG